jgi:hypothetical protein
MVAASNLAGVSNAIEASPSDTSLPGLDAVYLLLAGALSVFGPYVAVFLAGQNWTQEHRLRADGRWVRRIADSYHFPFRVT